MVNVAEILKQVPKGTKLWSNNFGEVELINVTDDIIDICFEGEHHWFTPDGKLKFLDGINGECVLWLSKDHRAWDDEALRILGIEKKPENSFNLQPFDKVLVRDSCSDKWHAGFFSHIADDPYLSYICVGCYWKYCIPYNEETKHLLGTNQEPPEKYRR